MTTSIALCTYNGERYIGEQLNSILKQTMKVDEIVVCDDGSTDNTLQIIETIANTTDISINIHHNENTIGVCSNFQKAINLCHGDIIFLCDQDDVWTPAKVEKTLLYFHQHPEKQVIFSNAMLIDEQGNPLPEKSLWQCFGLTPKGLLAINNHLGIELFANENRATGATMAVRRTFTPLHYFVDYCSRDILHDGTLAMLSLNSEQLGYINESLIGYRIHTGQKCGIGESFINPVSDDPRESSYTATLWSQNNLPMPLAERIHFIVTRQRRQHQPLGPFRMLGDSKKYRMFYRNRWCSFLLFDISKWSSSMYHRFFK